jgi:hypothetical protein
VELAASTAEEGRFVDVTAGELRCERLIAR